ncbi:hypothetical protein GPECTOR_33g592 [Gonium pectorale]|uniref:Uncharacterized protein n=1 Tax=Gonium pectorale TaxID=33097 RepID=A0A150GED4_GONPE|nr:hypothetical protein GPECTOR_33g592 [Gonium pectorale]|eukprot:KXZ47710.1 hypothetical protein GPECTOR_33g592 [Gonium pectorale]
MSLFPIQGGALVPGQQQEQAPGQRAEDPAAWLSNNASFQPSEVLQPQHPYGRYATQAEFLRAAERYLESSSDEDSDEGDTRGRGGGQAGGRRKEQAQQPGSHDAAATAVSNDRAAAAGGTVGVGPSGQAPRAREQEGRARARRSPSPSEGGGGGGGGKKRKRRRSRSRSRSRDRKGSSKHSRKRDKSRKRRRRSSSGSSSSGSDSDDDGRRRRRGNGLSEREKILRLERAAAAAGIAPRAAAALTAAAAATAKPILRGAAAQPGEVFYDTRGDVENLVYECPYGGKLSSYNRVDPLGLAKGARARRLLPGQVPPPGTYGWEEEESRGGAGGPYDGRYFGGRAVAAERSRRLRRVFMSEAPVLPGAGRAGAGSYGGGGGGPVAAGRGGWLTSKLDGPSVAAAATPAGGSRMAVPLPSFLPLGDPAAAAEAAGEGRRLTAEAAAAAAAAAAGGESAEEWVLRRTREFNVAVREAPGDVQLWLRFAAFQDTVARLLARRATEVAGSAAEKKLSILQRALEAHPGEARLLRAMMAACEPLFGQEDLMDRWDRLLRRSPGVPALWRDYLARRRSAFASTRRRAMQAAYCDALHALALERARAQRSLSSLPAAAAAGERSRLAGAVSELDVELVRLVLELADLELGSGASEVAVARLQALVEFHCFAPAGLDPRAVAVGGGGSGLGGLGGASGRLPAGALLRLFDNFWESGAPRAGEEGARGWAAWYRHEHDALWVGKAGPDADGAERRGREREDADGGSGEDGGGGWTGWLELPPLPAEPPPDLPPLPPEPPAEGQEGADGGGGDGEAAAEEGEVPPEGEDEGEQEPQLTEEELLAALGLRLDEQLEEMQRQGVPPEILLRWLRTERQRSSADWLPLRPPGAPPSGPSDEAAPEPDPHRVVRLDDIRDGIFPLDDPDLRLDLVLAGLALLGVPVCLPDPPQPPAAAAPAAAAASYLAGSSAAGCSSLGFLRLLPPAAAIAACQAHLPHAASLSPPVVPWCMQHESRRAFVARLLRALVTEGALADSPQGGALDAPSASTLYLGGLFEVLTARLFPAAGGGGLAAALTVYKHATAAVPAAVRRASGHHEALAVSYCSLVVSELEAAAAAAWGGGAGAGGGGAGGALPPARARALLLQALELYPHNPALLALRVRLGRLAASQCRLRRDMAALAAALRRAAEGSLEALAEEAGRAAAAGADLGPDHSSAPTAAAAVWWAQLAAEAGRPAAAISTAATADPRVGRLLEAAASARHLAPLAPVWTTYLEHEAAVAAAVAAAGGGGPVADPRVGAGGGAAAKRVFLRAVREAPLDKELWLRGLELLGCRGGCGGGAGAAGTAAAAAAGEPGAVAAAGQLSAREVSELLGVAGDKGVRLRTDVYETMLEHLAEQQ